MDNVDKAIYALEGRCEKCHYPNGEHWSGCWDAKKRALNESIKELERLLGVKKR